MENVIGLTLITVWLGSLAILAPLGLRRTARRRKFIARLIGQY